MTTRFAHLALEFSRVETRDDRGGMGDIPSDRPRTWPI